MSAPRAPIPFRAIREERPGPAWRALFEEAWPSYERWFLSEGPSARPSRTRGEDELRRHMPELLPIYRALVDLADGSSIVARFLAHYRPTPYLSGCSQVVWSSPEPYLVRNYDYHPDLWEASLCYTAWNGTRVIAMSECLWGVLDGMNEHGLCVSLAFGGRRVVGDGFGIPLVLRYVLEQCRSTKEAIDVLVRVPSHMAYNISVIDAVGSLATVQVSPDRPATVTRSAVATNHQGAIEWHAHATMTYTTERERFLLSRLGDSSETFERLTERFFDEPLFARDYKHGFGTLYTAVYLPERRAMELRWPDRVLKCSFDSFEPCEFPIRF